MMSFWPIKERQKTKGNKGLCYFGQRAREHILIVRREESHEHSLRYTEKNRNIQLINSGIILLSNYLFWWPCSLRAIFTEGVERGSFPWVCLQLEKLWWMNLTDRYSVFLCLPRKSIVSPCSTNELMLSKFVSVWVWISTEKNHVHYTFKELCDQRFLIAALKYSLSFSWRKPFLEPIFYGGLFKCKTKLTDKNTSIRRLKAVLWDALATEHNTGRNCAVTVNKRD